MLGTKPHTLVSPGGGLRVSGSACGRRGAPRGVSRVHLCPSGHHFFNFSDKIWPPRSRLHTKVAEFEVAFGF